MDIPELGEGTDISDEADMLMSQAELDDYLALHKLDVPDSANETQKRVLVREMRRSTRPRT